VTDTLGEQVRRATEVLIQALDKADEDRNRDLLRGIQPSTLYEAALTVMMRLVFVLCAEERDLFLLGEPAYDENLAVSTLRGQLAELADQFGDEVLERRYDAWTRLSAVFRAVYAGIEHEDLHIPAMGGSLFDPDRFAFLEGRPTGTSWLDTPSKPLPIDDRTVLLLLNSLQVLEHSHGALTLSYRALDVEQIGHVYEGLLEHTVVRLPEVTLGLKGSAKNRYPSLPLSEMESLLADGVEPLASRVAAVTGRGLPSVVGDLSKPVPKETLSAVAEACGGDNELTRRVQAVGNLVRSDAWGDLIVYHKDAFMVAPGSERRETGTHYTPRSLTEQIVTSALEPLVYVGPAEGQPPESWALRTPSELLSLKVCDPAMGSGAFLVQACRYISEKLAEAWSRAEDAGHTVTADGEVVEDLGSSDPMPRQQDDRLATARRMVAQRCIYGVDINPLAVELAKLSIWLVTLAKGRPFGFLDHNLRSGDSLLGIHRLQQLTRMRLTPETQQTQGGLLDDIVESAVSRATSIRLELRTGRERDISDVNARAALDQQARDVVGTIDVVADALMGEVVRRGPQASSLDTGLDALAMAAGKALDGDQGTVTALARRAQEGLDTDLPEGQSSRHPFHWPLEFPEVFAEGGFDAVVSNPPFAGGRLVGRRLGEAYARYLDYIRNWVKGSPDLCAYFFLRGFTLVRPGGGLGLIATKSISETGTRVVCLDQMVNRGCTIYAAVPRMTWPGKAAVVVSLVWVTSGPWAGASYLDGVRVSAITSALEVDSRIARPSRLAEFRGKYCQGQTIGGRGFELTLEERKALLEAEPRSSDVVFPLFNGQDLNQLPSLVPYRWVVYFRDWSEDEARQYPIAFDRLRQLVKPYRDSLTGQIHQRSFWKFWDLRPSLMSEVQSHSTLLASARVTKYITFRRVPSTNVYNDQTKLFFLYEWSDFALLQSSLHQEWAFWNAGTLGAATVRYSTSAALETWPMPDKSADLSELDDIGEQYHTTRDDLLVDRSLGLTDLYNLFHNQLAFDSDIKRLRFLHALMDIAALKAYGWTDIDPQHDFYDMDYLPPRDQVRFTLSPSARLEVLRRLSTLNRERFERQGTTGAARPRKKLAARGEDSSRTMGTLFAEAEGDESD
jgi:hypothetical protein